MITPGAFAVEDFAPRLSEVLEAGDAAFVQLRMKAFSGAASSDDEIARAAEILTPIAHGAGALFLLNDRPDLVRACGADGAHIGQDDMTVQEARRHLDRGHILGRTCHGSRRLAMAAGEEGADYVAFGSFYETGTKAVSHRASLDILRWCREEMALPSAAIGGITPENAAPLIRAGADYLAVCGGVWDYKSGAAEAVRAFNRLLDAAHHEKDSSGGA